jgi:hypothetical protein
MPARLASQGLGHRYEAFVGRDTRVDHVGSRSPSTIAPSAFAAAPTARSVHCCARRSAK